MSAEYVDRNLLFGVLALQMDFISRESLIAAMNAWVLQKQRPLGDILVDQGKLGANRRSLISALVEEHVALHHGDSHQSLVAVGVPKDLQRDLEQFSVDPDLHASLVHFAGPAPVEPNLGSTLVMGHGSADERFEILRPHAAGGLGEVHVALDRELNREVALKRIHDRHADRAESRSRFILEAEITGGLEHPGIVPVYALGTAADGRPYYAMRFIQGETLKEAIETLHTARTNSEQQRRIHLRQLLNRLIAVCNAIEYAHSRGVIHRDIKPKNIMHGKYGETLVVDWGLAKALGLRSEDASPHEKTLVPSGSGSAETLAGSAIGTPAFMSPEQAAGRLSEIGPASDVYSLGATLYMILTGQEPFESSDVGAMLGKVRKGDFVPPRERNHSVPAPLDAICRKAMCLRSEDRYSSCTALATDLEHWLADEPVSAFADPISTRAVRWIRRHRVVAASSAVLMTTLLMGLMVGTVVLGRANTQIKQANAEIVDANSRLQTESVEKEKQRQLAVIGEAEATRQLYVSRMNLAQRAWDDNNAGRTRELLESQTPEHTGGIDLRGWEWHYLWRQTHSELRILKYMSMCVAFTPDGQFLLSGSEDGTLQMWTADGTRQVWKVQAHKDRIDRVTVSGDGYVLATASTDRTLKLWDTATGNEMRSFPFDHRRRGGFAMSRDGKCLVAAAANGITVLSMTDGTPMNQLSPPLFRDIFALAPDENRLASADTEFTVSLWDLATGQEVQKLMSHRNQIDAVAFSPDGRWIVSGDRDGAIKTWDLQAGKEVGQFKGHTQGVNQFDFSTDGERFVSASDDATVKVWSLTGEELQTLRGHTSTVTDVAFSPDNQSITSGSWDESIRLWDAASVQEPVLRRVPAQAEGISFSPDGQWLAVSGNGTLIMFDGSNFLPLWSESVSAVIKSGNVRFDPTGKTIALGGVDGSVSIRNAQDGRLLRTFKVLDNQQITGLDFTHDGETMAVTGYQQVVLCNAATGTRLRLLNGHSSWVFNVGFSPDATLLATAGSDESDRLIRLWEVSTGREVRTLVGHDGAIQSVVFSTDGSHIISGGKDEMIRTWDVRTGAMVRAIKGHFGTVYSLVVSPDDRRLVSCSSDQSVKIWDAATGLELLTLKPDTGELIGLSLSPDGTRVAAGGSKKLLTIWDARTLTDERRDEIAAANVVERFFDTHVLRKNVVEAIQGDVTLSETLRKKALELAETRHVSPMELNDRSWSLASRPGLTPDQYELAVRCAEVADELAPDNGYYLNTLGVARYRCGNFVEAIKALSRSIETLSRSNEVTAKFFGGTLPADIAFLAMAHHQLGHADEAGKLLDQLRQLLETDRWKADAESKTFLQEAITLIRPTVNPTGEVPKESKP